MENENEGVGLLRFPAQNVLAFWRRKNAATELEAWIWLSAADYVIQQIPGTQEEAITLHLRGNWNSPVDDLSTAWNWPTRRVRRFLASLNQNGMISSDLNAVLQRQMTRSQWRRAVPKSLASRVMAKTSGKCVYCGVVLTMKLGLPNTYQPDHLFPVSGGGSDDPALLVPSCRTCNLRKGGKTLVEFIERLKASGAENDGDKAN